MLVHRALPAALLAGGVLALALVVRPAFEATPAFTLSVHGTDVEVVTAAPTIVRLEYGPSRNYGLFTAAQGPVKSHSFSLRGLEPGGTYHLRAVAVGAGAAGTSEDAVVRVPRRSWQPLVPTLAQWLTSVPHGKLALATFAPALAAPPAPVTDENQGTQIYATRRNGAVTIFALNTSSPAERVDQVFYVPGLAGRTVRVWGTGATIRGTKDSFADHLPPHAWRIYVVPPA